jgi:phosphorylcholine metabolism protein LicD
MGKISKLKMERRKEREHIKELLKNQSKQYDDIYKDNKTHTMIFNINQVKKIKNTKPDYITFYNEDTNKIIRTFSMNELTEELLKDTNTKLKEVKELENKLTNKAVDENDYKIYKPTERSKKVLISILELLVNKLKDSNISFFLEGGSLLGALRHNDIIPHDDDIDLGMLDIDFESDAMAKIYDELDGHDIIVDNVKYDLHSTFVNGIMKFYCPCDSINEYGQYKGNPCIDIFKYTIENDRVELFPPYFRQQFKNCYFNTDEFKPFQKIKFNKFELDIPAKSLEFLKRYYGDECLEKVRVEIRDKTYSKISNKEFTIQEVNNTL